MLSDSIPLMLSGFIGVLYVKTDQLMIKLYLGDSALGVYSVGVRLAETWGMFFLSLGVALYPRLINTNKENRAAEFTKSAELVTFLSAAASVLTSIAANLLVDILYKPEYAKAADVMIVYVWSNVFTALSIIRSYYYAIERKTKLNLYMNTLGLIINIFLNTLLIPKYGYVGASISTVISYFFSSYLFGYFDKGTREIFYIQSRALMSPFIYFAKLYKRAFRKN